MSKHRARSGRNSSSYSTSNFQRSLLLRFTSPAKAGRRRRNRGEAKREAEKSVAEAEEVAETKKLEKESKEKRYPEVTARMPQWTTLTIAHRIV